MLNKGCYKLPGQSFAGLDLTGWLWHVPRMLRRVINQQVFSSPGLQAEPIVGFSFYWVLTSSQCCVRSGLQASQVWFSLFLTCQAPCNLEKHTQPWNLEAWVQVLALLHINHVTVNKLFSFSESVCFENRVNINFQSQKIIVRIPSHSMKITVDCQVVWIHK